MRPGGTIPKNKFLFNNDEIEITNSYKYLGAIINSNGTFSLARDDLKNKGLKALFSMWKSISPGKIPPVAIASKLFDAMVKPIITYNSEVWGCEIPNTLQRHMTGNEIPNYEDKYMKYINECPYEKLHLKFCKMALGVKKQTSNIATRAEIGRYPLIIEINIAIIKFWLRLNNIDKDRIVVDALGANLDMQQKGIYTWTNMVKDILEKTDNSEIWINKKVTNEDNFIKHLRTKLQTNYEEMARRSMFNDERKSMHSKNKLRTYRTFKSNHKQEKYLSQIKNGHIRSSVAKMRLSAHHLMIEKGRHLGLDKEKRICNKCNMKEIENEFHAMMICPAYQNYRLILFQDIDKYSPKWKEMNSENQFIQLMKMTTLPVQTGQFIHNIITFDSIIKETT